MSNRCKFYLNWSIRFGVIRLESFDFNVGYLTLLDKKQEKIDFKIRTPNLQD